MCKCVLGDRKLNLSSDTAFFFFFFNFFLIITEMIVVALELQISQRLSNISSTM